MKLKDLPANAKVLWPDGSWRNLEGEIIDVPKKGGFRLIDEDNGEVTPYRRINKPVSRTYSAKEFIHERHSRIPSGQVQSYFEAYSKSIKELLLEIANKTSFIARVKFSANPDYTIDGEIEIDVPPGVDPEIVFKNLESVIRYEPTTYVQLGIRLPPPPDEIKTGLLFSQKSNEFVNARGKGVLLQTGTAWVDTETAKVRLFKTVNNHVLPNMERSGYKKPKEVFLRIHWNPYTQKPSREG